MRKTVSLSLGNENREENKIILNGVELDLTGVNYFALECTVNQGMSGVNINWVIGTTREINLPKEILNGTEN